MIESKDDDLLPQTSPEITGSPTEPEGTPNSADDTPVRPPARDDSDDSDADAR
ncbi:MAG: hypothetical protein ACRDRJ_47800 [Streptosporangiaceae bacterium]